MTKDGPPLIHLPKWPKRKKNSNSNHAPVISPATYVKQRARALPIGPCFASRDEIDQDATIGLVQMVITRAKPSGKFMVGIYLVDVSCLGVKKTTFHTNFDESELKGLVEDMGASENKSLVQVDYAWAHRLIYDSIDYAQTLGFTPEKEFAITRYILEPKEAIADDFGFEFGKDGKPFLIVGPYDNGLKLINTLSRTVGEGNFDCIMPMGGTSDSDDW